MQLTSPFGLLQADNNMPVGSCRGGSQGRNRHPISAGLILGAKKANSAFLQAITQKVGNTKLVPQAKDS